MEKLTCACVQMRTSDIPQDNIRDALAMIREAAARGADFIATPEATSFLDIRPGGTRAKAKLEPEDDALVALREEARSLGIWLLIGSLAVKLENETRLANRSYLIDPKGGVVARYDKIHMFDVDVGDGQSYRESKGYRPGGEAVLAQTPFGAIGMTVCYDLRFAYLYRMLAQAGASILTIPASFTHLTGQAHWHILVRARAIETGSYVIAPTQGGKHADGRETFGHSLIVSPWGEVLADGGTEPGVVTAEIDLTQVREARRRIPALTHDRALTLRTI